MTPAEAHLWERLRAGKLNGLHFRRQHPIANFILDFYCHQYHLGLEIDGEIHFQIDQKERDIGREIELKELGLKILRFSNRLVLTEPQEVLRIILMEIDEIKQNIEKDK